MSSFGWETTGVSTNVWFETKIRQIRWNNQFELFGLIDHEFGLFGDPTFFGTAFALVKAFGHAFGIEWYAFLG
jgi:hypothetical protein